MASRNGRTGFAHLVVQVKSEYRSRRSWRRVGAFYGVSGATARRVSLGYEPRTPRLRVALGLPLYITVQACAKCGIDHDRIKTCPDKRKPRRRWVPPLLEAIRAAYRRMEPEEISKL